MDFKESEVVELKEVVTDDIKKEIIAFANSAGGTLYIGIADDGKITGVLNPEDVILQIANMVRDNIKPDITMFLRYGIKDVNGQNIIVVEIQGGTGRPYYLAKKGLRPEGVFVRQGTSSVPATDTAIRRMIKETDGNTFEDMRSLEQVLTFEAAKREFAGRKMELASPQMKTLGILSKDGIYTNLGHLLSDQCSHMVKVAAFEGSDQNIFRDRREFSGSLLQQLNEIYDYIDMRNQTRAIFDKLYRIDKRDYPEVAIREALLNSIVHRDYSFSASGLVGIYSDRIEFTTIGGLITGISLDDIMLGISVCRNPKLANIFYRLELIEAYGTGIKKIMKSYEDSGKKPIIETTSNAFKIILPNRNEKNLRQDQNQPKSLEAEVLELAKGKKSISRKDVEEITNLKQTAAGSLLRSLVEQNLLLREGSGKNTEYIIK